MATLDVITAGESHGVGITTIVSGLPLGVPVDESFINAELARRQGGFGRSGRMGIEHDRVEFLGGVYKGLTTGAPVAMIIRNRDSRLHDEKRTPPLTAPRPGHADLAGAMKFLTHDCRPIVERASARETAGRVAAGALIACMLREFGITTCGFVRAIGGVSINSNALDGLLKSELTRGSREGVPANASALASLRAARDGSETYCPDAAATAAQVSAIKAAKDARDTLGGVVEMHVLGVPPGLGSCMDWRDKLDARIAMSVMSVQAIKGVEIGLGFEAASLRGSAVHDEIHTNAASHLQAPSATHAQCSSPRSDIPTPPGLSRSTNNAGGIEGGMSNGEAIIVRAAMKPISTLLMGRASVDLATGQATRSQYERSDICAVPAACVVVEQVVAFEVARAFREKFGGDSMSEVRAQVAAYAKLLRNLPMAPPETTLAGEG